MNIQNHTHPAHEIPSGRLWFGAAGAAIAWALQGFTCFEIAVQACKDGGSSWGSLSGLGVRVLLGVVTAAYLGIASASGVVSYMNWRSLVENRHLFQAEGIGREEYMALTGVFVGAATVLGLIWAGIPPLFLDVCNTYR